MQLQNDYFAAYHSLKLTRDDKGVLVAEFHSDGGPFIMSAPAHTELVDAFYRISQDRMHHGVVHYLRFCNPGGWASLSREYNGGFFGYCRN
jgi:hypothetical protein